MDKVDEFTLLGSTLSRAVHIDDEMTARIAKASEGFGRLRAIAGSESSLTTLLYASETWTVYQRHAKRQPFPLKLFEKVVKHQVARQHSRHRGPEESRDAYRLKASTAVMAML